MTIIVGIDGSPVSRQALDWAVAEGALRATPVRAVHVWEIATGASPSGHVFGGPVDGALIADFDDQRRAAEQRLAETVAAIDGAEAVERHVVEGDPATVLCEASREGELLVVGSHGHGGIASVLLGSVSQACTLHAACPVVVVREPDATDESEQGWDPVGPDADRVLADFLRREHGYVVGVEPGGVTGQTSPIPISPDRLDVWVETMVLAGREHGGCAFGGWTATLQAGRTA
jgi:nucleotide-binding universal stress UspA family protein